VIPATPVQLRTSHAPAAPDTQSVISLYKPFTGGINFAMPQRVRRSLPYKDCSENNTHCLTCRFEL